MAITLPYSVAGFWDTFHLLDGSSEFELLPYEQMSMDGGGNFVGAKLAESKWTADVSVAPLYDVDAKAFEAKINTLRGRDGAFLAYDKRRPYPEFDPDGSKLGNGSSVIIGGEAAFGDTTTGTYRYEGGTVTLTQAVTVASDAGTYFDGYGVLQAASVNAVRVDYGPFANQARNPRATGAVAGTPGTLPDGWFVSVGTTALTREVVSRSIVDGIDYVRFRFSGTSAAASSITIGFDASFAKAVTGQTWTGALFRRLEDGSLTGLSNHRITMSENTSGGSFVAGNTTAIAAPTGAPLAAQRATATRTFSGGGTVGAASHSYGIDVANGALVNFTIDIGFPTLELAASASAWPRVPLGVLAETGFTNRVTRSREFDNAAWSKLRTTVTANVAGITDPWGTALADKLVEDGTAANTHILYQAYTTTNYVNHVAYVIAKAAERTIFKLRLANFTSDQCGATFDLVAGTVSGVASGTTDFTGASAFITSLGNGWYWCELEALKLSGDTDCIPLVALCDASGNETYNGDGTSGIYLAHAQMEEGTTGHKPLVTTTAAVARAGDQPTFKAKGRNDWTYTRDNGTTGTYPDISGDLLPNINILSRPYFKAWSAIRDTQPAASNVQVKSKGSNNRSLALKGLPPFYSLKAGERLSISNGSSRIGLFEIDEDVTADYLGETVEFEIQPFMPSWIAVNQAVTLANAPGKFKIIRGSYKRGQVDGRRTVGKSFQMISVY